MNQPYQPEQYWDNVAGQIASRNDLKLIAGDDEPYYRYKRKRFLQILNQLNLEGKSVLEIGSGPGGNLDHISGRNCKRIAGADISSNMIGLASELLRGKGVELFKINGRQLPFADNEFDLVFTSTVLQHNTDEVSLRELMKEIARVAGSEIVLFERIEKKIKGHASNLGRPVAYYAAAMQDEGFELSTTRSMPIQASYYACGLIRKVFNHAQRREGEPLTRTSILLERLVLPITRLLDQVIPSKRDVMMLHFEKK